jgi:hypothetical protein
LADIVDIEPSQEAEARGDKGNLKPCSVTEQDAPVCNSALFQYTLRTGIHADTAF